MPYSLRCLALSGPPEYGERRCLTTDSYCLTQCLLRVKLRPSPPAWHVRSAAGSGHVHDQPHCARSCPLAGLKLQLPLYSQKRTQLGSRDRSETCQQRSSPEESRWLADQSPPVQLTQSSSAPNPAHRQTHRSPEQGCSRQSNHRGIRATASIAQDPSPQRERLISFPRRTTRES
jgi:hypothetical protein